jgi:DNA recombination protein RmuC
MVITLDTFIQLAMLGLLGASLSFSLRGRLSSGAVLQQLSAIATELRAREREQREELAALEARLRLDAAQQAADLRHWREELRSGVEAKLEMVRGLVEQKLREIQVSNDQKLEQLRMTVDEKLQSTLEQRLGASFAQVSEHLASLQRGLGEVQSLAQGVGTLNRVLTNVKTRGTFGETQLEAILSDMLHAGQYVREYSPRGDGARVEFAVRLPAGAEGGVGCPTFIPIDAKFPREDYERMLQASEGGDSVMYEVARKGLLRTIEESARSVGEKYIAPPATTNFAIMFLATEGLYAEVLREPGLQERIQRDHRVIITGPTTLSAILTSLAVGFQTLAIQERSVEIRRVLEVVRSEFGKFAHVLGRVQKQLGTATRSIEETFRRTRSMERALQGVDAPSDVAQLPSRTEIFEWQESGEGDEEAAGGVSQRGG